MGQCHCSSEPGSCPGLGWRTSMGLLAAGSLSLQLSLLGQRGETRHLPLPSSTTSTHGRGQHQAYCNLGARTHEVPGSGVGTRLAPARLAAKRWDSHHHVLLREAAGHTSSTPPTLTHIAPAPWPPRKQKMQRSLGRRERRRPGSQGTGEQAR